MQRPEAKEHVNLKLIQCGEIDGEESRIRIRPVSLAEVWALPCSWWS